MITKGVNMNDALNTLLVNLKNFNWKTNIQYRIDKNEGEKIIRALEEIKEEDELLRCPHCFKTIKKRGKIIG